MDILNENYGPYYVLYGRETEGSTFENLFGDYDRDCVQFEKEDYKDHEWSTLMIKRFKSDDQKPIDDMLNTLNGDL